MPAWKKNVNRRGKGINQGDSSQKKGYEGDFIIKKRVGGGGLARRFSRGGRARVCTSGK